MKTGAESTERSLEVRHDRPHPPPLFAADLSRAPIGLQVPIRARMGRDASEVHEVIGQHVGAGLFLHFDVDTDPDSDEHPPIWTVSDGLTGLRVAFSLDPLYAIQQAYQRLVLERGRPSDLQGSVQDAVRAILVRVRRDLPEDLRQQEAAQPLVVDDAKPRKVRTENTVMLDTSLF